MHFLPAHATPPNWLRRHWLTLVLLFVYGLMSLLVIEQGRTIDAQRTLIRQLFSDSLELTAVRMREAERSHQR